MSSVEDFGIHPSWDPKWVAVNRQYRQNVCTGHTASLDANTLLLQRHLDRLAHLFADKDKDSNKDMYMTFVDDLLLGTCKDPSSEGNALEGTMLGDMEPSCACLAAVFFLS